MSYIIFEYDHVRTKIQCNPKEKISSVFARFCIKIQKDKSHLKLLYNGNLLDEQKTVEQIPKNSDDQIMVLVIDPSSPNQSTQIQAKSNVVICPFCKENASVSIDDNYKISINNCKNGHKKENLNISKFDSTQMFDMSKVICGQCKDKNVSDVFEHEFFRCLNCKMNLCTLCRHQAHNSKHNIINYSKKNYICDEHGEPCIYYCMTCKKNICFSCDDVHNNHEIIDFKNLKKNKDDLENKLTKFREYIDKAKELVQADIKNYSDVWSKVVDNLETVYRIKKEIFDLIKSGQRNYETLSSQEFIIKNFDNDFNEIINYL